MRVLLIFLVATVTTVAPETWSLVPSFKEFFKEQSDNVKTFYNDAVTMKDSVDNYVEEQQQMIKNNIHNYVDDIQTARTLVDPLSYYPVGDTQPQIENPDVVLSVPGIITRNGYICETHTVISQGYVLNVHRIPRSRHGSGVPSKTVLLQHGLFASSADWIMNGPGKGLGYVLADAGYDVWMTNIRGNRYSKDHVWFKPNSQSYWDFSWHEVAKYDVPAVIDYILETKGADTKMTYIGHSMGTTILFAMLTLKPEYNDILTAGFALAPVVYLSDMKSPLKSMAPIASNLAYIDELQGTYEFIPKNSALGKISSTCNGENMDSLICKNIVFYLCGFNERQFNKTLLPVFLAHLGTGTSWKTAVHFSQEILSGKFQQFDYGYLNNWRIYRSGSPPEYDLKKVTLPIKLFWSKNDLLSSEKDVMALYNKLPSNPEMFLVPDEKFNHLDYLWAIDAPRLLNNEVLNSLHSYMSDYSFSVRF
nr:lipase 3 [Helicoverpa armigera]